MTRRLAVPLCAALLAALSACAVTTPPISHLQLDAGPTATPSRDSPIVLIYRVALPDYLLRNELIVRKDDTMLRYDPYLRWAEPLDLGIQRVLARQLGGLLDTRQVIRFPDVARGTEDYRLHVDVHRFETLGQRAVLQATGRWEAGDGPGTVASVDFDDSLALSDGGAEVARALSALLARFSGELAAALRSELTAAP